MAWATGPAHVTAAVIVRARTAARALLLPPLLTRFPFLIQARLHLQISLDHLPFPHTRHCAGRARSGDAGLHTYRGRSGGVRSTGLIVFCVSCGIPAMVGRVDGRRGGIVGGRSVERLNFGRRGGRGRSTVYACTEVELKVRREKVRGRAMGRGGGSSRREGGHGVRHCDCADGIGSSVAEAECVGVRGKEGERRVWRVSRPMTKKEEGKRGSELVRDRRYAYV